MSPNLSARVDKLLDYVSSSSPTELDIQIDLSPSSAFPSRIPLPMPLRNVILQKRPQTAIVRTGNEPVKVDTAIEKWAGGQKAFEDIVQEWRKAGVLTAKTRGPWTEDSIRLFRAFTQIRKLKGDKKLKGDDRFLAIDKEDMLWWLKNKVDVEVTVTLSATRMRKGDQQHFINAKNLEAFADFVLQDRADKNTAIEYESRAYNINMRPWSGDLITEVLARAKAVRDQTTPKGPLQTFYFAQAIEDVFGQKATNGPGVAPASTTKTSTIVTLGSDISTRDKAGQKRKTPLSPGAGSLPKKRTILDHFRPPPRTNEKTAR